MGTFKTEERLYICYEYWEVFIIRKLDLKGKQFGRLTIIEETVNPNNKKKSVFWRCVCECGNESILDTSSLTSGKSTQCCDCGRRSAAKKRRKDYTGKRFGKLTVLKMIHVENEDTRCECICDCGKIIYRKIDGLNKKTMSSCGCAFKEIKRKNTGRNVDGEQFGKLTVLETLWDKNPARVKCKCECGNIGLYTKRDVVSGHTQSCGCLHSETASNANIKRWTGYISNYGVKLLQQHSQTKTGQWKWECLCPLCGNNFIALPNYVKRGHTTSCGCRNTSSKETLIENYLKEFDIEYKTQYIIADCKYKQSLRFDFAILKNGEVFYLLEYDGRQHFEPVSCFGGESGFKKTVIRDQIKNKYCKQNNISLLRFKYTLSDLEIKEKIANITYP